MSESAVKYKSVAASTVVAKGLSKYYGYIVTTVTAVAAIQIRDASAAGAGTVIDTIATATAIGVKSILPHPIQCEAGITFDLNGGTGGVTLLYEGNP
jgi:hypothetical protein